MCLLSVGGTVVEWCAFRVWGAGRNFVVWKVFMYDRSGIEFSEEVGLGRCNVDLAGNRS